MIAEKSAAAGAVLWLAGCAFEPALTAQIVDYNRVAEDVGNSVLLLNVLRARDRKPFYFTQIGQLNPSVSGSLSLNLSAPLNPISYTTLSVSPGASVSSSNGGSIAIEASKEFTSGIMKPINADLFDYFWQRGWPRAMLLNIFVQKIEVVEVDDEGEPKKNAEVRVFFNGPARSGGPPDPSKTQCEENRFKLGEARAQFECFQRLLRALEPVLRFASTEKVSEVTPPLRRDARALMDWKALVEAAKNNISLVADKDKGTYYLAKVTAPKQLCIAHFAYELDQSSHRRSSAFICDRPPPSAKKPQTNRPRAKERRQAPPASRSGAAPAAYEAPTKDEIEKLPTESLREAYTALNGFCGGTEKRCLFYVHLRSPEAMLYYLGEVVRANHQSGGRFRLLVFDKRYAASDPPRSDCIAREKDERYYMSLIEVERGAVTPGDTAAAVRYEGEAYYVPRKGCHVSMQALSLVSQIFALQRSSSELPVTTFVRTISP